MTCNVIPINTVSDSSLFFCEIPSELWFPYPHCIPFAPRCCMASWIPRTVVRCSIISLHTWSPARAPGLAAARRKNISKNGVSLPDSTTFTMETYASWWFQPLWKILVSWGFYSKYMEKNPNHQPVWKMINYSILGCPAFRQTRMMAVGLAFLNKPNFEITVLRAISLQLQHSDQISVTCASWHFSDINSDTCSDIYPDMYV